MNLIHVQNFFDWYNSFIKEYILKNIVYIFPNEDPSSNWKQILKKK